MGATRYLGDGIDVRTSAMQNGVSTSTFVTAPDGLRLHARCYGSNSTTATTVVCLPGLARTTADFEPLAVALTQRAARAA